MSKDPASPMTAATRERLVETSHTFQQISENFFDALVEIRRKNRSRLSANLLRILETQEFLALVNFELSVLIEDIATAASDLRANFYTRTLLLTVFESSKSLRSILNHEFRAAVLNVVEEPGLDDLLKSAHSQVTNLFGRCDAEFGDVRNGLLGHRDRDAETRVQLLEKAGTEPVVSLTIDMMVALDPVIRALFVIWHSPRLGDHFRSTVGS